jgi:hypothetical protein
VFSIGGDDLGSANADLYFSIATSSGTTETLNTNTPESDLMVMGLEMRLAKGRLEIDICFRRLVI